MLLPGVNWTYGLTADAVESAEEFIGESMKWSCRICASTALMRMEALPEAGDDRQDDFPAIDFGMWLRMAAAAGSSRSSRETLGAYRIHGARTRPRSARRRGRATCSARRSSRA